MIHSPVSLLRFSGLRALVVICAPAPVKIFHRSIRKSCSDYKGSTHLEMTRASNRRRKMIWWECSPMPHSISTHGLRLSTPRFIVFYQENTWIICTLTRSSRLPHQKTVSSSLRKSLAVRWPMCHGCALDSSLAWRCKKSLTSNQMLRQS